MLYENFILFRCLINMTFERTYLDAFCAGKCMHSQTLEMITTGLCEIHIGCNSRAHVVKPVPNSSISSECQSLDCLGVRVVV